MPPIAVKLHDGLRGVERRARRLTWIGGLSALAITLLGGMVVFGAADRFLHFDHPAARLLLDGLLLFVCGRLIWSRLCEPLTTKVPLSVLAMQVERANPEARGWLTSAADFLESDLGRDRGSQRLQQEVLRSAEDSLANLNWNQALDTTAVRRLLAIACVVGVSSVTLAMAYPSQSSVAVRRLLLPWASIPWPRTVQLELVTSRFEPVVHDPEDPIRAAVGETLELYALNLNGSLPDEVWLETRSDPLELPSRRSLPVHQVRDREGTTHDAVLVSHVVGQSPAEFRVVAGDDDTMPFYRIEPVPPPRLASLKVELIPPAYSRRPTVVLPANVGNVSGLLGSRVRVSGTSTKPLQAGWLIRGTETTGKVALSKDGLSFQAEFTIEAPNASYYGFRLKDRQGFSDPLPARYEVFGEVDGVPSVQFVEPARDLLATPDAEIPFQISATDDLELASLDLVWRLESAPVDAAQRRGLPLPETESTAPSSTTSALVSGVLRPSEWSAVAGQRFLVHPEARDRYDLGPPHVGRGVARTITIVTPGEKEQELGTRVGRLLEDLSAAKSTQQAARTTTHELATQWSSTGELRPADRDALRRLGMDQRSLSDRLLRAPMSVAAQAEAVTRELRENQLDDAETRRTMEQLEQGLRESLATRLPELEDKLTRLSRSAASNETSAREETSSLFAAIPDLQQNVADRLSEMEILLGDWQGRRQISAIGRDLLNDQAELSRRARELAATTMTRPAADLSPQERADLAKLADRQIKLAERVEQLEQRLNTLAETFQQKDPETAAAARSLLDDLRRQPLSADIRETGRAIGENRMGQALDAQQKLEQTLRTAFERFDRLRPDGLDEQLALVKKQQDELLQLESLQQELRDQQEQLVKKNDAKEAETLRQKQSAARGRAEETARELQRLQLRNSRAAVAAAAEAMRQAESAQAADDVGQAIQRQDEALEALDEAQAALEEESDALRERLNQELARVYAQELAALVIRQEGVGTEISRLDALREENGSFTRAQLRSLRDLTVTQTDIAGEVDRITTAWNPDSVTTFALSNVSKLMTNVSARLQARETGKSVQSLAATAANRLRSLADLLAENSGGKPGDDSDSDSKSSNASPPSGNPPSPRITQLKLLRSMQEACLEETRAWRERTVKGPALADEDQQRIEMLADQQRELGTLLDEILSELSAASDPMPAAPPAGDSLPRELFNSLNAPDEVPSPANQPLPAAPMPSDLPERMWTASRKIADNQFDEPTLDLQAGIVADLTRLIDDLSRQPPPENEPNNSPSSSRQPRQSSSQSSQSGDQQESESQADAPADALNSVNAPGTASDNPTDSEATTGRKAATREELMRQSLQTDVWGHLPPQVRQQLLNGLNERMLPGYEALIRQFYSTLAEGAKTRPAESRPNETR